MSYGIGVVDIGSSSCRFGLAGDDQPRANLRGVVGVKSEDSGKKKEFEKSSSSSTASLGSSRNTRGNFAFDEELFDFEEGMIVQPVFEEGIVKDWHLYEQLWYYAIESRLDMNLRDTSVLVAESPYTPQHDRKKLCELLFEAFQVPSMFMAKDVVLSCYACGRTTGLIVDCGASGTTIAPVIDGWVESRGLNRSPLGGRYLDAYAAHMLRNTVYKGSDLVTSFRLKRQTANGAKLAQVTPSYDAYMNLDLARHFRERVSITAESSLPDIGKEGKGSITTLAHELPDGTSLELGLERYQLSETLFSPASAAPFDTDRDSAALGMKTLNDNSTLLQLGLPHLACEAVSRCDGEAQALLLHNVVLAGGVAETAGMPERLRTEIEHTLLAGNSRNASAQVRQFSPQPGGRALATWLGGSILGSLGSWRDMCVSKAEYDEHGSSILEKKCP